MVHNPDDSISRCDSVAGFDFRKRLAFSLPVNEVDMTRLEVITPLFVEFIPTDLQEGIVYISRKYEVAVHLCACGCGIKTCMPINEEPIGGYIGWHMTEDNGVVSFTPSIGNFSGESPYHAHYHITENKIVWS